MYKTIILSIVNTLWIMGQNSGYLINESFRLYTVKLLVQILLSAMMDFAVSGPWVIKLKRALYYLFDKFTNNICKIHSNAHI